MSAPQEIQAKLGIDTTPVPHDLSNAAEQFAKFGKKVEGSGAEHGAGFGEHFTEAIGKHLSTHHLGNAVAAALGINIEKISEGIAAAIAGGNAEGWKEAQTIIDENAKLIEEKITKAFTPKQLSEHLEKELAKAVDELANFQPKKTFLQEEGIGAGQLNAEQLKEQAELQNKVLQLEIKIAEQKRKDAEEEKKFLEEWHSLQEEGLSDDGKIVAATSKKIDLEKELAKEGLTRAEQHKIELDILRQENVIREAKKKIEADTAKAIDEALKKEFEGIEKNAKAMEAAAKRRKELETTAREQRLKVEEDRNKLSDRSKLTIGELANITGDNNSAGFGKTNLDLRFGQDAGLSQDQIALKKRAQEAEDLKADAERLRLAGRQGESDEALKKLDAMRTDLVSSGAVKSTEDPTKMLIEQLKTDTDKLDKTNSEIRDILKGKFKNE